MLDDETLFAATEDALGHLAALEADLTRAEREPFGHWYTQSWCRRLNHRLDLHRSHDNLRRFMAQRFTGRLFTVTPVEADGLTAEADALQPGETLRAAITFTPSADLPADEDSSVLRLAVGDDLGAQIRRATWSGGLLGVMATPEPSDGNHAGQFKIAEVGLNEGGTPKPLRLTVYVTRLPEPHAAWTKTLATLEVAATGEERFTHERAFASDAVADAFTVQAESLLDVQTLDGVELKIDRLTPKSATFGPMLQRPHPHITAE